MLFSDYTRNCAFCGREFVSPRRDTRYCGPNCRKAASRRPQQIERAAEQARAHIQRLSTLADEYTDLADLVAAHLQEIAAIAAAATDDNNSTNM